MTFESAGEMYHLFVFFRPADIIGVGLDKPLGETLNADNDILVRKIF